MSSDQIRGQYRWREVKAPKFWRPQEPGEEISGYYGGQTIRCGQFGEYSMAIIHVPLGQSWMISGSQIIQKIDAACVPLSYPIRVVWKGYKELGGDRRMKQFDVFVAEGNADEPCPACESGHGCEPHGTTMPGRPVSGARKEIPGMADDTLDADVIEEYEKLE